MALTRRALSRSSPPCLVSPPIRWNLVPAHCLPAPSSTSLSRIRPTPYLCDGSHSDRYTESHRGLSSAVFSVSAHSCQHRRVSSQPGGLRRTAPGVRVPAHSLTHIRHLSQGRVTVNATATAPSAKESSRIQNIATQFGAGDLDRLLLAHCGGSITTTTTTKHKGLMAPPKPAVGPGKRGPWSSVEDERLMHWIGIFGPLNWVRVSAELVTRTPKQCRERYHQNLKPSLNHEPISHEEGMLINRLVQRFGRRWADIARRLKGRSDNAVKNWWNGSQNRRRRLERRRALLPPSPARGGRGAPAGVGVPSSHGHQHYHHSSHLDPRSRPQGLLGHHNQEERRPQAEPMQLPPLCLSPSAAGLGTAALTSPCFAEAQGQHRRFPWADAPLLSPCSSDLAGSDSSSNYTTSPAGSSRALGRCPVLPPLRDLQRIDPGRSRLPSFSSLPSPASLRGERLVLRPRAPSPHPHAQLLTAPSSPVQVQEQDRGQGKRDKPTGGRDSRMDLSSLLDD